MSKLNSKGELYVLFQIFLFCLLVFGPRTIEHLPLWSDTLRVFTKPFGSLLIITGIVFCFAAMKNLDSNLSALPHPKDNATLIQTGFYALVRHPIYCGLLLAAIGWSLFRGSTLMLLYSTILFVFFEVKSRREERQLLKRFPEYESYKAKVKKLIPFLY